MKTATSFNHFISIRLLSAALVICVLWYFVARDLYWLALDSTSEFYLFKDAEQALQAYKSGTDIGSFNTPFKQLFLAINDLPDDIANHMHLEDYQLNEVSLVITETQDVYFLAWQDDPAEPIIYVVHRFATEDTQDISPVLYLISFLVLFLMFALMWFVVARLQQQSNKLKRYLVDMGHSESLEDIQFEISEFQAIYDEVQSANQERLLASLREKQYSAFLSHEIRHSLASINANIEKLEQIDGFPLAALPPMEKARQESEELQRIANAILALWQTDRLTLSNLDIVSEFKNHVAQSAIEEIQLEWHVSSNTKGIPCNRDLFHLLCRQLLQNVRQYGRSKMELSITDNYLRISNDVSLAMPSEKEKYGYNVGMLLVTKICESMHWHLEQTQEPDWFSITIRFDGSPEV